MVFKDSILLLSLKIPECYINFIFVLFLSATKTVQYLQGNGNSHLFSEYSRQHLYSSFWGYCGSRFTSSVACFPQTGILSFVFNVLFCSLVVRASFFFFFLSILSWNLTLNFCYKVGICKELLQLYHVGALLLTRFKWIMFVFNCTYSGSLYWFCTTSSIWFVWNFQVVGLDLVDDESKPERRPTKHMPTPAQWTNAFNPAFSYYVYYCYANLCTLNKVFNDQNLELSIIPLSRV